MNQNIFIYSEFTTYLHITPNARINIERLHCNATLVHNIIWVQMSNNVTLLSQIQIQMGIQRRSCQEWLAREAGEEFGLIFRVHFVSSIRSKISRSVSSPSLEHRCARAFQQRHEQSPVVPFYHSDESSHPSMQGLPVGNISWYKCSEVYHGIQTVLILTII